MHERAWILVVDGQVEIEAAGETEKGGPGFLALTDPNERHEVRAISDARLVLVLAPWPGEGHPSQTEIVRALRGAALRHPRQSPGARGGARRRRAARARTSSCSAGDYALVGRVPAGEREAPARSSTRTTGSAATPTAGSRSRGRTRQRVAAPLDRVLPSTRLGGKRTESCSRCRDDRARRRVRLPCLPAQRHAHLHAGGHRRRPTSCSPTATPRS